MRKGQSVTKCVVCFAEETWQMCRPDSRVVRLKSIERRRKKKKKGGRCFRRYRASGRAASTNWC